MKKEHRKKLNAAELRAAGVSREIVVRKIRRPDKADSPGSNEPETYNTSERPSSTSGGVGPRDRGDQASGDREREGDAGKRRG